MPASATIPARAPAPAGAPPGLTPPSQRGRSPRLIGQVILDFGFADRETIERAVADARATGRTTGQVLVESGAVTAEQLARAVAERMGVDHVDLTQFKVDMGAANLIGSMAAKRYGAVPIAFQGPAGLLVAMSDPSNVLAVDDIGMLTGLAVVPAIASPDDIAILITRLNRLDEAVATGEDEEVDAAGITEITDLRASADDAPIIKLVHSVIAQAVEQGASDIHFAPEAGDMKVQYRVDGVLVDAMTVPKRMQGAVTSRIKVMADMDIADRRMPQDGRLGLTVDGRPVDVRIVTLPLVGGESVVLRILDKSSARIDLDNLGMQPEEKARFRTAFSRAYGAVLVCGPTGSGKTSTLYAALNELNDGRRSVLTIEDPVEYRVDGVRQMQVNAKAGVTFATGLRSMMRADPDVVMVGEVRDHPTAHIAVEAALTGHLVLSTLHTNDAPTAITRLIEMGTEPFLVASAIDCVVAQRLARKLCTSCRRPVTVSPDVMRAAGYEVSGDMVVYEAVGCGRCAGTGYKGRTGLFEVMPVTEEIRSLALERAPADRIAAVAVRQGMRRLRDDGLEKVRAGITSPAEVARVTGSV